MIYRKHTNYGVALESVDSYKDLGVIVDSYLLFDKHT